MFETIKYKSWNYK